VSFGAAGVLLVSGGILAAGADWMGPYWALLTWNFWLQSSLALSYNILGGYGGELHLGHGCFFGLGSYLAAGLYLGGLPWWLCPLAAGLGGACLSLGVGPWLLPQRGVPFALSSLSLVLMGGALARNLEPLTGGSAGLSIPLPQGMEGPYRWALMIFMAAFWIHHVLPDSRFGRALRAVAHEPLGAAVMGIDGAAVRFGALVLGSFMASMAGGVYPFVMGYLSPESTFGLTAAMAPVVCALLGGVATPYGPLVGAILYVGAREWLGLLGEGGYPAWLGGFLIAVGLFFPRGIAVYIKGWRS